ncbi:MAG: maleylpyruvate isomerase family mycothiol-dependent enzyme [Anaerolineae bacterium]|jgi:uncharacterized protein (TIGR03083 family)
MAEPQPIVVTELFPELLEHLLVLLSELSARDWAQPTECAGWSVKEVALHLLGGDAGILSRKRDQFSPARQRIHNTEELVALIDGLNADWIQATQRLSPRLLCDLLRFMGEQVCDYFQSLDPHALGGPVSWAGPEPAPVWLDLAREYTERWHHQQHIRDAVGRPGLKGPRYLAPALDAFVRALPYTYRHVSAPDGALVTLTISGPSGGRWSLLRVQGHWHLYCDITHEPDAEAVIDEDSAWRLFTKGLDRQEAQARVILLGDRSLGSRVLDMVSIIG